MLRQNLRLYVFDFAQAIKFRKTTEIIYAILCNLFVIIMHFKVKSTVTKMYGLKDPNIDIYKKVPLRGTIRGTIENPVEYLRWNFSTKIV